MRRRRARGAEAMGAYRIACIPNCDRSIRNPDPQFDDNRSSEVSLLCTMLNICDKCRSLTTPSLTMHTHTNGKWRAQMQMHLQMPWLALALARVSLGYWKKILIFSPRARPCTSISQPRPLPYFSLPPPAPCGSPPLVLVLYLYLNKGLRVWGFQRQAA